MKDILETLRKVVVPLLITEGVPKAAEHKINVSAS
jgi:hypothetical protein